MRSLLGAVLMMILGAACTNEEARTSAEERPIVAGDEVPPFPTNYGYTSVRPVGGAASTHDALWVSGPDGGEIWLAKRLNTDSVLGPTWRFLARTPRPRAGVVMFDGCWPLAGPALPLLIGAEMDSLTAAPGAIREAWVMDTIAGAFVPMSPKAVQCAHLDTTA